MSNVHIVVKGDSLSKIAKRYAVSVSELCVINDLPDPNKLKIGEKIRLRKQRVLGVQALILDSDRNPIEGLAYQFDFAGRVIKGITGLNGLTKQIMTPTPQDQVRILLERLDSSLKEVASVTSGYGNKLVTLISPSVKIEARTERHPNLEPGQLPDRKDKIKPIYDPKVNKPPTLYKRELGLKATSTATPDGKPLIKIVGDIPDLSFLSDDFNPQTLQENDFIEAAEQLGVSVNHIKTVTEVEAQGRFFIREAKLKICVPPILFERHLFSRHSQQRFDGLYPDISSKKPGGYLGKFPEYRRLVKAVQLDREAALKSASWGAFQILGEHFKALGFATAEEFVKYISKSEKNQLNIFVRACTKVNPVWKKALQNQDWPAFAKAYNGRNYKINRYDEKLKQAFDTLSKQK